MKKSNKHIYYVSRFVVLLFWNIITWKIWSNITYFRMQISLYRLSRNMDGFLASRNMSASEYLDHYENYVQYLYGWSFCRIGFGARAFLKSLYQRIREERINSYVRITSDLYGKAKHYMDGRDD